MRLPTASSLERASVCAASHVLPWAEQGSPAASRGTAAEDEQRSQQKRGPTVHGLYLRVRLKLTGKGTSNEYADV